jgi:hypothetical protein
LGLSLKFGPIFSSMNWIRNPTIRFEVYKLIVLE